MSEKKTFVFALCILAVVAVSGARAEPVPDTAEDRLRVFAQCAGRFSAEMEHAWLLGLDASGLQAGRQEMIDLIEALGPVSSLAGRDILALRIDSKMAHAALLTRATFARDPQARALARRYVARCASLLPAEPDLAALD